MWNGQAWLCAEVEWLNETYFDFSAISSCIHARPQKTQPQMACRKRPSAWGDRIPACLRPEAGAWHPDALDVQCSR
jgi:hypothetical protein